jgi:hypothetical protein
MVARKNHLDSCEDKNSPFNHAKVAPQLIRAPWWGMGWLSADGP